MPPDGGFGALYDGDETMRERVGSLIATTLSEV